MKYHKNFYRSNYLAKKVIYLDSSKWQSINNRACACIRCIISDQTAKIYFILHGNEKLYSKCGEDWSTNDVLIWCTDVGQMDRERTCHSGQTIMISRLRKTN